MLILLAAILGLLGTVPAGAAACGGVTACNCNDTVTSNYTMSADLLCTYSTAGTRGLRMTTAGVTLDLAGHTIDGNNSNGGTQPILPFPNDATTPILNNTCVPITAATVTVKSTVAGAIIKGCTFGITLNGVSTGATLTGTNITIQSPSFAGIQALSGATGTITAWTIAGYFGYGIDNLSAMTVSNNTMTGGLGNVALNSGCGIRQQTNNATITGNTVSGSMNSGGCDTSSGSTWTSNTFANNKKGAFAVAFTNYGGANTTNTSDGAPVYVYNATSSQTYNYAGATVGEIICGGCTGNTFTNGVLLGQMVLTCTTCTVSSMTAASPISSGTGTALIDIVGDSATVTGNTLSGAVNGSFADCIHVNGLTPTITSNTLKHCGTAIWIGNGATSGTVSGNTLRYNFNDILDQTGGSLIAYTSNTAAYEIYLWGMPDGDTPLAKRVDFTDSRTTYNVGSAVSFAFNLTNYDGTACSTCTYTVQTFPPTAIASAKVSAAVTGSFIPSAAGTYSLLVTMLDSGANTFKRNYTYIVGPTASTSSQYFLATGQSSKVYSGGGMDAQPASLTNPGGLLYVYCSSWWQMSPLETPNYPLAYLTSFTSSVYYSSQDPGATGTWAFQRFAQYSNTVTARWQTSALTLTAKNVFATATPSFAPNIMVDMPSAWNALSAGLFNGLNPKALSNYSANTSSYTLTYSYASTAPVKSISSADSTVLSSTSGIVFLDNPSATSSQTLIVGGFANSTSYPVVLDGTSTGNVSSDGSGLLTFTVSLTAGIHAVTFQIAAGPGASGAGRNAMSRTVAR